MSNKISIILARANWCHFCRDFEPIYNLAKDIHKKFDELKNYDIDFEDYDLADDDIKNTFMVNYYDLKDKLKGYPTVFVNFKNKNQKINNYVTIDHTIVNDNVKQDNQHIDAAERFIKNIINILMSKNSDNKILYVQDGGNNKCEFKNDYDNDDYKKKIP